jgi:TRAP-type C4-dicarboxylate transport system substrate-binding protein
VVKFMTRIIWLPTGMMINKKIWDMFPDDDWIFVES